MTDDLCVALLVITAGAAVLADETAIVVNADSGPGRRVGEKKS